jgi:hypothetical protein
LVLSVFLGGLLVGFRGHGGISWAGFITAGLSVVLYFGLLACGLLAFSKANVGDLLQDFLQLD